MNTEIKINISYDAKYDHFCINTQKKNILENIYTSFANEDLAIAYLKGLLITLKQMEKSND